MVTVNMNQGRRAATHPSKLQIQWQLFVQLTSRTSAELLSNRSYNRIRWAACEYAVSSGCPDFLSTNTHYSLVDRIILATLTESTVLDTANDVLTLFVRDHLSASTQMGIVNEGIDRES